MLYACSSAPESPVGLVVVGDIFGVSSACL